MAERVKIVEVVPRDLASRFRAPAGPALPDRRVRPPWGVWVFHTQ